MRFTQQVLCKCEQYLALGLTLLNKALIVQVHAEEIDIQQNFLIYLLNQLFEPLIFQPF